MKHFSSRRLPAARNLEQPNPHNARNTEENEHELNWENFSYGFLERSFIATILYSFWNAYGSYDNIAFYLHALLYTTYCYRWSLDRKGSFLLLAMLSVPIMIVFHIRPYYNLVLLSSTLATGLSMFLMPFYVFQKGMMVKCIADFVLTGFMQGRMFTNVINSHFTDLLSVFVIVGIEIWQSLNSKRHNSIEDILLILIGMGHIYVFCFEYFTLYDLSIILSLTVSWMFLKSLRFQRLKSVLEYKFYADLANMD